jgi:hypothetical protein
LRRILVDRVDQVAGLIGARLESRGQQVESLLTVLREPGPDELPRGLRRLAHVGVKGVGEIERRLRQVGKILLRRVDRGDAVLRERLERVVYLLD